MGLRKDPWIVKIYHLTLGISRQNEASLLEIPQNCVTSIGISKVRNQDQWKFRMILPLEIQFPYFFNPGIFTFFCFSISLEIPCFCPPLIWIFLGTVQFLSNDLQCAHNWKMHLSFTNSSHTSAWSDHYCSHLEEPPHKFFTQKRSPMKGYFFGKNPLILLGGPPSTLIIWWLLFIIPINKVRIYT